MGLSLESIVTGREHKPPRIVFYGPMGVGKTTLAAAAPDPVFIQVEDGAGKLDLPRFPLVEKFEDVMDALKLLYRDEHNYKTVVIDTLSRLEQIVHDEIRKTKGDEIFAHFGRGYKLAEPYFERLIQGLNALRDRKGMMVLVLGHSDIERYESPEVDAYDRYMLNCHDKIRDLVYQWCDMMLFGTYKVSVRKEELGFNQSRGRGIGKGERVIYTEERPTHLAKNRYDLPHEVPFKKPFEWDKLLGHIGFKFGPRKAVDDEAADDTFEDVPGASIEEKQPVEAAAE